VGGVQFPSWESSWRVSSKLWDGDNGNFPRFSTTVMGEAEEKGPIKGPAKGTHFTGSQKGNESKRDQKSVTYLTKNHTPKRGVSS